VTTGYFAGRIGYFGPQGENGREWFEMLPHARGQTVRAFCEMDEFELTRDVTISLDADARPRDAFVRITQHGRVLGSTWFLVGDDEIHCEGITADLGRVSQTRPLARRLDYLGLHPLVCDGLIALSRGTSRPGEFIALDIITNSLSPNGEQGLIAMPSFIDVAYLADETVTVPAGRFDARHYALRWQPDWPAAHLWVHGPSALFLRLTWDMIDSRYELMAVRTSR
jgi:hypothetical protein